MENGIVKAEGQGIDFSKPEMIKTLKATVAQGLSDPEFALFAEHCKGTGLNPFKKEVWAIKAGNRLQIMTGLNGYLQIANSHPQFDGMTVEVDNDQKPSKAICKVYRKDRKYPAEGVALMSEYGKSTPIWQQMPRVMLTKVAKSIALREAFPQELNGTYTEEEMPSDYKAPIVKVEAQPEVVESQAQPAMQHQYDLSKLDPAKHPKAIVLLQKAGAITTDEKYKLYWESPTLIDQLNKYLVKEEVTA